jgi:hypothetical protein
MARVVTEFLTLYVNVYDLSQTIEDEAVKKDVRHIFANTVNRHRVDWTVMLRPATTTYSESLKKTGLQFELFALKPNVQ